MPRTFVKAIKSDGTVPVFNEITGYCTLASGTTYYFEMTGPGDILTSAHFQWDASIIITSLVMEDSNLPGNLATAYSSAVGDWMTENPTGAYIPVVGAGVAATASTVAASGGAVGACLFNISDQGTWRQRYKLVVGATGGSLRCAVWNKGQ